MYKKYNNHLFTFGNNEKPEYDQVLTGKAELNLKQTLDYMWEIIPNYQNNIYKNINFNYNILEGDNKNEKNEENEKDKIRVLYDTLKVEEFLVKNKPYQQLSDHFGVSVELSYPHNS